MRTNPRPGNGLLQPVVAKAGMVPRKRYRRAFVPRLKLPQVGLPLSWTAKSPPKKASYRQQ